MHDHLTNFSQIGVPQLLARPLFLCCCKPAKESINIGQYFVIGLMVQYPMFQARQIYWSKDGATRLKGEMSIEEVWESHGRAGPHSPVSPSPCRSRPDPSPCACRPAVLLHASVCPKPPLLPCVPLPFTETRLHQPCQPKPPTSTTGNGAGPPYLAAHIVPEHIVRGGPRPQTVRRDVQTL